MSAAVEPPPAPVRALSALAILHRLDPASAEYEIAACSAANTALREAIDLAKDLKSEAVARIMARGFLSDTDSAKRAIVSSLAARLDNMSIWEAHEFLRSIENRSSSQESLRYFNEEIYPNKVPSSDLYNTEAVAWLVASARVRALPRERLLAWRRGVLGCIAQERLAAPAAKCRVRDLPLSMLEALTRAPFANAIGG